MTMPRLNSGKGGLYTLFEMGTPVLVGSSKELSEYLGITVNNFRVIRHRKGVYKNVYTIKEGTHANE